MQVYQSESLSISIEEQVLLIYRWNENSRKLSTEEFLKNAKNIHDQIVKNNVKYVIADDRKFFFSIAPDLQELIAKEMLSSLNNIGFKRFAHVCSSEVIAQLSVEQLFEENQDAMYIDKYFESEQEAREWIME